VALRLDHVTTLTVALSEQQQIGPTKHGWRRVSPVAGGAAVGPRLTGEVLPGGADWNLVLPDGSIEFDARYTIRADDGTLILVNNVGIERAQMAKLFAGSPIDPDAPFYARTLPRFEVGPGPHEWLAWSLFVAELSLGGPGVAVLDVYEVA
jgi:hypothetical protein